MELEPLLFQFFLGSRVFDPIKFYMFCVELEAGLAPHRFVGPSCLVFRSVAVEILPEELHDSHHSEMRTKYNLGGF